MCTPCHKMGRFVFNNCSLVRDEAVNARMCVCVSRFVRNGTLYVVACFPLSASHKFTNKLRDPCLSFVIFVKNLTPSPANKK